MSESCNNIFAEEGYQHFNLSWADKRRERGAPFHGTKWRWNKALFVWGNFAPVLTLLLTSLVEIWFPPPLSLPTFIIFHAEECVACKPSFLSLTNFFLRLWGKKKNSPSSPTWPSVSPLSGAPAPCNNILHFGRAFIPLWQTWEINFLPFKSLGLRVWLDEGKVCSETLQPNQAQRGTQDFPQWGILMARFNDMSVLCCTGAFSQGRITVWEYSQCGVGRLRFGDWGLNSHCCHKICWVTSGYPFALNLTRAVVRLAES